MQGLVGNRKARGNAPAVHTMVAQLAKEMAGTTYERIASRSNEFFAQNPKQSVWIAQAWPLFVEDARATLAKMLQRDMPESLRESIAEALMLDGRLLYARPERINSVVRTLGSGALPTARLEDK